MTNKVVYELGFGQDGALVHEHLLEVGVTAAVAPAQQLWLPVWIPGSYLIREFARHVEALEATVDGQPVSVKKISKSRWQLGNDAHGQLRLRYRVYAFDLSVRGSCVDAQRIHVNPATCCLVVAGLERQPHQVVLARPPGFEAAELVCALPATALDATTAASRGWQWQAPDHATLIDSPFEVARVVRFGFVAGGLAHEVAISGRHHTHVPRLQQDLQRLCQAQIDFFGGAPFAHYVFMVMATGHVYGGLEHQSCTSLITPRDDLPVASEPVHPSSGYQRFLGLCSHEYFHAWLVKCIRPEAMVQPDLEREVYLPLLWVFEGLTSYYDDQMLYRAGLIGQAAYLKLLEDQITRHWQTPGHQVQTLAEAGLDAWIKYYRPDENSPNATTSYYHHGALAGLSLDLLLREHGQSLDALLRWLYQQAQQGQHVTETGLQQQLERWAGGQAQVFWQQHIEGTVPLPLATQLAHVGLELHTDHKPGTLGMKLQETPAGLVVQQVLRGSPAAQAGISAHDQLVAIGGVRATPTLVQKIASTAQQAVDVQVFRRDELLALTLRPQNLTQPVARLTVTDPLALARWLPTEASASARGNP